MYDYAIPAEDLDWESGKPVIIDLTDYLDNITDGKLIVYAEDYARNYSAIEYTLYTDDDIDAGVSDTEKLIRIHCRIRSVKAYTKPDW